MKINDVNDKNAPKNSYEILKGLNNVNTNKMENPLCSQENTHQILEFCTQNEDRLESNSPQNISLLFITLSHVAHFAAVQ